MKVPEINFARTHWNTFVFSSCNFGKWKSCMAPKITLKPKRFGKRFGYDTLSMANYAEPL